MFASDLIPCQPFARDQRTELYEAIRIRCMPFVVPKCLFIDVPRKMDWLDTHVCPMKISFQKAPEILHRISVHVTVHVFDGVRV